MADARATVKITGDAHGLDATLDQAGKSFGNFKKLALIGVGTAVAGGLAAVGTAATRAASDFQQGMANVGAISRATDSEMQALTATAKNLGATTAFTAKEAADGMSFLAMAGFNASETIAAMPGTLALAAAGALDLASAADISSNVLSGFGLSAAEADRAANVLAATASSANTNVFELGEAFKMAAPVAAALGVSMEDTSAALAALADGGIKATMAGTSVRQMLLSLSGPTPEAAGLIESLGIQAFTAEGKLKDLPTVIGEVARGVGGLNEQAKIETLGTIFGARNVGPVSLLLERGADALAEYSEGITGTNAAADMAARQLDTFQGAMTLLQSAVSGAMIELGDAFLPVLRLFVEAITGAITAAQPFVIFFGQKLAESIETMRGALAPAAAVIGELFSRLAPFAEALAVVIGNNLTPIIIGLSVALMAAAVPALAAVWALVGSVVGTVVAAAAPFVLLGAVVAAVVAAIQNNFLGIRDALTALGAQFVQNLILIRDSILALPANLALAWEQIVVGVQDLVARASEAWGSFLEALAGVRDMVVEWAVGLWESALAVFQGGVDLLRSAVDGVRDAIGTGFQAAVDLARDIFERFKPVFVVLGAAALAIVGPWIIAFMAGRAAAQAAVDFLQSTVAPAIQSFAETVSGFFGDMRAGVSDAADGASSDVQASASELSSGAASTFADFRDRAVEIWTTFRDRVVELSNALRAKVVEIAQAIAAFLIEVWTWIKNNVIARVVALVQGAVGVLLAFFAWGVRFWTAVIRVIHAAWQAIGRTVAGFVQKAANVVIDLLTRLGNWVGGYWDKFTDLVFGAWKAIYDVVRGALKSVWDTITSVFRGIVQSIGDAMAAAGGIVTKVFAEIQGFLSRMGAALGAFGGPLAAAAGAVGDALSGAKSKIEGLAKSAVTGLKAAGGEVQDFFSGLVHKAKSKFAGMFKGLKFDGAEGLFDGAAPEIQGAAADLGALAGDSLNQSLEDIVGGDEGGGGGGGGSKAKSKKAKTAQAPAKKSAKESAAAAIADLAKKVAEAIQEGLAALEALAGAELPPREAWAARLEALTDFVQTAVERFQEIALSTLTHIDVVDGVEQVSTAKADAVTATLKVLDGMFGVMAKAVQIAQAIANAEFPEGTEAVDGLRDFLVQLRDRAVEVADGVAPEAAEALGKVGAAIKVWVELFGDAIDAAVALTAEGVDLSGLDSSATAVQAFLLRIADVGRVFVEGLEAAVPDEDARAKSLELSGKIAQTFGVWVAVVAKIGAATSDLAKIPQVPDIREGLTRALTGIANAGGAFVVAIEQAYESTRDQAKALALSGSVAQTFAVWFKSLEGLVAIATNLRKLSAVPDDVGTHIARVLGTIASASYSVFEGLTRIPIEDAAQSLTLSGAVAQTFGAWIAALKDLVAVVSGLRDVGAEGVQAAFDQVVGFLDDLVAASLPHVLPLLEAGKEQAGEALAISGAVAQTFGAWIAATRDLAVLIREAAETPILEAGVLAAILGNVDAVRAAFEEQAVEWANAQVDARETLANVQVFAGLVKTVTEIFGMGQKLSGELPQVVDYWAVALSKVNVDRVVYQIQALAEAWARAQDDMDATVGIVQAFQSAVGAVVAVFKAGQGLVLADVTILAGDELAVVLDNVERVRTSVQALAEKWAETVDDMAKANGILDAYAKAVGAAASVLSTAGGIALGEVTAIVQDALDVALDNASRILAAVQGLALEWAATVDEATRLSSIMEAWGKSVAGAVASMLAGAQAGLDTATAVTDETIRLALSNADRVRAMAQELAMAWADNVETAKDLGARIEAWSKATGGAVDVLGKASEVFSAIQSSNVAGDITFQIDAIRDNIVRVLRALSDAFVQAEQEAGTLKRADELSAVVKPAVEAIAKVIDTLSLDKLTKNPLFNLKAGSAFATRTRKNRLDHLAEQIREGIRRVVVTIVEALADIDVPANVESDFDRLATAFERIADIMARIQGGIGDVDMGALREFLDAAMFLAEGAAKIQGVLGPVAGGVPLPELPGVVGGQVGPIPGVGPPVTMPPPSTGDPIFEPPVEGTPGPPVDMSATVVNEVTVQIGEDVLAKVIERTRAREAYVNTTAGTES